MRRFVLAVGLLLLCCGRCGAVGFQWATVQDADAAPLQVAIWYPSDSTVTQTSVWPFDMNVAMNGTVSGGRYALIIFSHGTGGMALNEYDTAIALAEAGFVVAAMTHTGDSYQDQATAFTAQNFVDRPRHVSRVIDFMLGTWSGHDTIDAARIGVFGNSAGGTTALIAAGGIADMNKVIAFCQDNTDDWGCRQAQQRGVVRTAASGPISSADKRIKAIVLAAPAVVEAFDPDGLKGVTLPVQLWVGAEDEIARNAPMAGVLLPMPPEYHLVSRAGHFAFLAPCSDMPQNIAPEICKDPVGFDRVAFHRDFQRSIIAFYQDRLK